MERVNALINKLQELVQQHAGAAEILAVTQQLQAELILHITSAPARPMSTAKVAVMMPSGNRMGPVADEPYTPPVAQEPMPVAKNGTDKNGVDKNGADRNGADKNYQPVPAKKEAPESAEWSVDPLKEIPTLAHQEQIHKEINDLIGQPHTSLNDRLKTGKTELADVLTEVPVRDLKKAIGINDRYVFVNELFRGDEAMYERSIKTINAFRILPEAEYWMERELKVKLAWDDGKATTQHFYQLVKRRFS
jgi:hypothetical protein